MHHPRDPIESIIESTYEFGRIMRQQMVEDIHGSRPVNFLQLYTLIIIREQHGITMSRLAQLLRVRAPSATSLVKRLQSRGWVYRSHDRRNRRLVRLSLTPLGARVLREKTERRKRILRKVFRLLTLKEQRQLARLHQKLQRRIVQTSSL